MAIRNFDLRAEKQTNLPLEQVIFADVSFNVKHFTHEMTKVVLDILKEKATMEIPLYPQDTALELRKQKDIAKKILDDYSEFIDLGLLNIAVIKESIYKF